MQESVYSKSCLQMFRGRKGALLFTETKDLSDYRRRCLPVKVNMEGEQGSACFPPAQQCTQYILDVRGLWDFPSASPPPQPGVSRSVCRSQTHLSRTGSIAVPAAVDALVGSCDRAIHKAVTSLLITSPRKSDLAKMSFEFVVHDGPKITRDPAIRTLIRKQAMKDVALARKRRGNHSCSSARQILPCNNTVPTRKSMVGEDATSSSDERVSSADSTTNDELVIRPTIQHDTRLRKRRAEWTRVNEQLPGLILLTDYEATRSKFGVDLLDLSLLASFGIGRDAARMLSTLPEGLNGLLSRQFWSFLEHVPSRYGQDEAIRYATDCVLAKAITLLVPNTKNLYLPQSRVLYGKALQSVQKAIGDDVRCGDADVLCATQLLSLYELLDFDRGGAFSQHVAGTARLIKHRTPSRYQSEYEKALFACHVGSILSECLLRDEHCFLEDSAWMSVYRSLTIDQDSLTDRSALCIDCRAAMIPLPGIWYDVTTVVNSDAFLEAADFPDVEGRCRQMHKSLIDWLEQYKMHCVRTSMSIPTDRELGLRRELFGMTLECLCLVKRLLAALCDADRFVLEVEGQALAHLLLDLQKQKAPQHAWLFSSHEIGVACNTIITKEQWEEDLSQHPKREQNLAIRTRSPQGQYWDGNTPVIDTCPRNGPCVTFDAKVQRRIGHARTQER
nr:uncharacterized protein CFP56_53567 [Quercus suber]